MRRALPVVVLLVAIVAGGVFLQVIIARSPHTHAHIHVYKDPDYSRTGVVFVGPPALYSGMTAARLPGASGNLVEQGRRLLVTKGCATCHGLAGQGGAVGPSIAGFGVADLRRRTERGPGGMPRYASGVLTDADLTAIAAFLQTQPTATVAPQTTLPSPPVPPPAAATVAPTAVPSAGSTVVVTVPTIGPVPAAATAVSTSATSVPVQATTAALPRTAKLEIYDWGFRPAEIVVAPGQITLVARNTGRRSHGILIEELGVDEDVYPRRTKKIRFQAEKPGRYLILCNNDQCGTKAQHEGMRTVLVVKAPTTPTTAAVQPAAPQVHATVAPAVSTEAPQGAVTVAPTAPPATAAPTATPVPVQATTAALPRTAKLEIYDWGFRPAEIVVAPGQITLVARNTGRRMHGVLIEELGVDEDVYAHRTKKIRFQAEQPGRYLILCNNDQCGTKAQHEGMRAVLVVK